MPKVSRTQKIRSKAASVAALRKTPLISPDEKLNNTGIHNNNEGPTIPNTKNGEFTKNNNGDKSVALSRGQRKRQAKRDQYIKKEKMILSTLKLQRMEEQKNRIDGLDAIKEALTQTIKENQARLEAQKNKESSSEAVLLKTNKAKKDVAQKELNHMNLVLQHPSFQSNPFATIQEHLRNTLAKQATEQEEVAKKERQDDAKKEKEKKEAKKERIRNAKYEKGRKQRRRRNY